MNCRIEWNIEFIENSFTKVFVKNTYYPEKTKLLLDRQKSMLPETQPIVEILHNRVDLIGDINKMKDKKQDLYDEIRNIDNEISLIYRRIANAEDAHAGKRLMKPNESPKKEFIKKCPFNNCNGFLSTAWKCSLCNCNVCPKCHQIKSCGEEESEMSPHICNEDDIKSVALIKKDSKPCPKCNSLIFKIDGCNQMWCTNCHVAFNWVTLQIEVGRVHNPEYFRWMREHGGGMPREEDRICGGDADIVTFYPLHTFLTRIRPPNFKQIEFSKWDCQSKAIIECFRQMNHLRYYEMPRFEDINSESKKQSLRIKFMMKEISEEQWLKQLITLEKINKRKYDYRCLIDMVTQCISDNLGLHMRENRFTEKMFNIQSLNEIIDYYNTHMDNLAKKYKTRSLLFNRIYISN
tara:strand:- start:560 stop:1777 length:1218 start_codon:yes stop_codon:yes gene_type:complete